MTLPPPVIPNELLRQLKYPACRYEVNADLVRCIIDTRAVIDRANVDRMAVKDMRQGEGSERGSKLQQAAH